MNIQKQKCAQCGMEVQAFNMENHLKNHELEKKIALAAAAKAAAEKKG
ncbi:MAG TPA: hypothetical protein VJH23_05970 [archaeon]|nr:hypothetical protein [archaeon]